MDSMLNRLADLSPEKRALLAKSLRSVTDTSQALVSEPIAIVGIGCRFPGGANDPASFWRLLRDGVDAISEVPAERWSLDAFYDPNPETPGKITTRWGGFLKDSDRFDAAFFGISRREAMYMDPQQRLLLEVAWEALEHAGQPIDQLAGSKTGVFVGVSGNDYSLMQNRDPLQLDMYSGTGCAANIVAGRLAFLLDLRGPCVSLDTACSSSLVAVHLACQSLRGSECRMALAGGVNLLLAPFSSISISKMHMLAPDGRCKTFDAAADGFVRSEGCGVVVLKRLSDALHDRDPILALIRGSAVNQDGRSASLTAPNAESQQALIRDALANANVDPATISYVETHGTGTALGDPIEVETLSVVLGQPSERPCALGAVKTNIGHTEATAGIAGLIKTVLALHHEMIPPNLHFQALNPHIALERTRFVLPTALQSWPSGDERRYATVSSFGWSGTNACVVLEEAPPAVPAVATSSEQMAYLLLLSARSVDGLVAQAQCYAALLNQPDAPALADLVYTAGVRRSHHEHRLALVGSSAAELRLSLEAFLRGEPRAGLSSGVVPSAGVPKVVFVFPGQGSQWVGMARQLLAHEPVFRHTLDACATAFQPYVDWSLLDVLAHDAPLERIDVIQPTLFAIAVGLSALWQSWGVRPAAVIGHSMGEIAAAYVAGALSLEDAARVICVRSRLLRRVSGQGAMALVELPLDAAATALGAEAARVAVAVSNSPRTTVLSGEVAALEAVLGRLTTAGVFWRWVKVDVASHSPQMDPLLPELRALLAGLRPQAGQVPIFSTVTGTVLTGAELDGEYWVCNLREPVRFSTMVAQLLTSGHTMFVELSPHPILLPSVENCITELGRTGQVLASLRREMDERMTLLEALGGLYTHGYPVAWERLSARGQCVPLPSYPWQRERYWLELSHDQPHGRIASTLADDGHPLLGAHISPAAQPDTQYWQAELSQATLPYLSDHQVQGLVVLPATAYLDLALAGAQALFGDGPHALTHIAFVQLLTLEPEALRLVQLALLGITSTQARFEVLSRPAEGEQASWTLHAHGTITRATTPPPAAHDLFATQARCGERLSGAAYYARLAEQGLSYGASFQGVAAVWCGTGEALARLERSATVRAEARRYPLHPALLDAALQVLTATLPAEDTATYVPVAIEAVRYLGCTSAELWSHAQLRGAVTGAAGGWQGDVTLCDGQGVALVEVRGLRVQRLVAAAPDVLQAWGYVLDWEPQARSDEPDAAVATPSSWVLIGGPEAVSATLAAALHTRGATCRVVGTDATAGRALAEMRQVLETSNGTGGCNVVFLDGLEAVETSAPTLASLEASQARGVVRLTALVQALVQLGWRDAPRLWVVTQATQRVTSSDVIVQPGQAPLWGLGRTVMYEHPELRCTVIDLAAGTADGAAEMLAGELWSRAQEDQVALRASGRYVARLRRLMDATPGGPERTAARGRAYRLESARPGTLEQLVLRATRRRAPGPGEVEIAVAAMALSSSDQPGEIMSQSVCAGTINAIGPDVSGLMPGDAVLACVFSGLENVVTVPATTVVPMPAPLDFVAAAGLLNGALAALYGLYQLAQLTTGERVLIHSAASDGGLAALQIARRVGAEIFATDGTPEKRAFLHSLGVAHVYDSRSPRLADEIMADTDGAGVDVVLNSLSGDAIPASLTLLGPQGRFVDLCRHAIDQGDRLDLSLFRNGLAYFAVDMAGLLKSRPQRFHAVLREATQCLADGTLQAQPVHVFPIARVSEAFHTMAQGRHIGKIVIALDEQEQVLIAPPAAPATPVQADGSYLITGGLGGLGLTVAHWLVAQGARHLALLGRSAPSEAARAELAALTAAGANVQVLATDVARPDQLAHALDTIARTLPPLRGVIHAAGVLDDGIILQLTAERFTQVMAPKLNGAWNLHQLTRDLPLDFFVLFSSGASLLGSPGQANYAAANAFLDALAHYRRAEGLPGTSINWGPWAAIGLAAAQANRGERLVYRGMDSMTQAQGLDALERLLRLDVAQAGVLPLNLRQWRQFYPKVAAAPLFSHLAAEHERSAAAARQGKHQIRETLQQAELQQRRATLEEYLRGEIAQVLRVEPARIKLDTPFKSLGFDSLMAIEFRNRLETSMGLTLPATLVWTYPMAAQLAEHLAAKLGIALDATPEEPAAVAEQHWDEIEDLSRDELADLLMQELEKIDEGITL